MLSLLDENILGVPYNDSFEIQVHQKEEGLTNEVAGQDVAKFMGTFGNMNYEGQINNATTTIVETTNNQEDTAEQIAEFQNDSFVIQ